MNLVYCPRWDKTFHGRTVNIARTFYPKLATDYEMDDLVQEGYIIFLRCKRKYKGTVDNPKWFMSLYSRALTNLYINLLTKVKRYSFIASVEELPEVATEQDDGFIKVLLTEMPAEVKQLFNDVVAGTVADGRMAFAAIRRKNPKVFN